MENTWERLRMQIRTTHTHTHLSDSLFCCLLSVGFFFFATRIVWRLLAHTPRWCHQRAQHHTTFSLSVEGRWRQSSRNRDKHRDSGDLLRGERKEKKKKNNNRPIFQVGQSLQLVHIECHRSKPMARWLFNGEITASGQLLRRKKKPKRRRRLSLAQRVCCASEHNGSSRRRYVALAVGSQQEKCYNPKGGESHREKEKYLVDIYL